MEHMWRFFFLNASDANGAPKNNHISVEIPLKGNTPNKQRRRLQPSEHKKKKEKKKITPSHMSYDNQMLKFNFIALQGFGQISAPVADSALSTQPRALLCFHMGTGGFAVTTEHAFRRPCFRANKGSSSLPCACAADFSHNDDSHYTHASH